jgi:BMFP domain-containing protein YqiC
MAMTIPVDLLNKLTAQLREQLGGQMPPTEELEKILQALLQSAVARLDLVSRSEFDAQCKVLARTRERLEQAEKQLLEFSSTQG